MTTLETVTLTRDRVDYGAMVDTYIDRFRRAELKKVDEECDRFKTYTYLLLQSGWKAPDPQPQPEPKE